MLPPGRSAGVECSPDLLDPLDDMSGAFVVVAQGFVEAVPVASLDEDRDHVLPPAVCAVGNREAEPAMMERQQLIDEAVRQDDRWARRP